ncbi:MAG: 50S ribosomal protein L25 [Bacillota bacterium]
MHESLRLMITIRAKGSKGAMNRLRKEGFLPCSLSKKGGDAVSFFLRKDDFRKAFAANGTASIYTLQADQKTAFTAMIHEIQYVPGAGDYLHVTFQSVTLTEETTADIHLHIKGREELLHKGFELLQQLESIHLKGLPGDFPASIDIDVSGMEPGDLVTAADVKLPKGIACLTESNRLIVSVPHPKLKEEAAAKEQEPPKEEPAKPAEASGE